MSILSVERVTCGYVEGIDILRDVSLEIREQEITGIIGPNGAGKSTLLNTIFGFLHPRSGKILFEGAEIQKCHPYQLKRMGIGYVRQEYGTFPQLAVRDNLLLGAWILRKNRGLVKERLEEVYELFPLLAEKRGEKATYLSGGLLRMLCIGKEIMAKPKLLLIDEPSAGVAPMIVKDIYDLLVRIAELGATILLVDQNIIKAVEAAQFMYVLEMGEIKRGGPKEDFKECIREIIRDSLMGG